jgi:hypothetical protein
MAGLAVTTNEEEKPAMMGESAPLPASLPSYFGQCLLRSFGQLTRNPTGA